MQTLDKEFECIFLMQNPEEIIQAIFSQEKASLIILTNNQDELLQEANYLSENYLQGDEIVVLDGYHFNSDYQQTIKKKGGQLVYIDDVHDKHYYADTIINHGLGIRKESYSVESYTKLYLGLDFVLLRKPFLQAAQIIQYRSVESIKSILILIGGADPFNLTCKLAQVAQSIPSFENIVIVTGGAYQYGDDLRPILSMDERFQHFTNLNANELTELFLKSDLGICPASNVAIEAIATKLPLAIGHFVDNQRYIYKFTTERGWVLPLGDFNTQSKPVLIKLLEQMVSQIDKINSVGYQLNQAIDGRSSIRLLKIFRNLDYQKHLHVRAATGQDIHQYFDWANEPETRLNAIDQNPIAFDVHQKWFNSKIEAKDDKLYVMEYKGQAVGQIRFDYKSTYYLISYSLDKRFRGKGLGNKLVERGIKLLAKEIITPLVLKAMVKNENVASLKVFDFNNFKVIEPTYIEGTEYQVFLKDIV